MRDRFRADANEGIGVRFLTDVMEGRIKPATAAYYEKVTRRLYRAIMAGD
jgi:hypothetical protein